MRVPELRSCCCGCTLETGSSIIAWLWIIFGALSVIGSIIGLIGGNQQLSTQNSVAALIAGAISLATGVLLLKGIRSRNPNNVHWWILVNTILFVLDIVYILYITIASFIGASAGEGFSFLISGLIGLAIMAYLIIVVYNYKREIGGDGQPA